jgi:hypothetical protein
MEVAEGHFSFNLGQSDQMHNRRHFYIRKIYLFIKKNFTANNCLSSAYITFSFSFSSIYLRYIIAITGDLNETLTRLGHS